MNRRAQRWTLRAVPLLLLTLGVGCQSGPTVAEVQEENGRQHRVLQQTISQLRKGLDEVRNQRDDAQTKYHSASTELETAQMELSFLESVMRAEREIGTSRGNQLNSRTSELTRTKNELSAAKERISKLERELTSTRVAFEADQQLLKKMEQNEANFASRIASIEEKSKITAKSWEAERRGYREKLQAAEDEVAVLRERMADGEAGVIAKVPNPTTTEISRGRPDYYETPPPRPTVNATGGNEPSVATTEVKSSPPVAAVNTGKSGNNGSTSARNQPTETTTNRAGVRDVAVVTPPTGASNSSSPNPVASEDTGGVKDFLAQVKSGWAFAVVQFKSFIENPGENYKALLHPIPIGIIVVVLGLPLLLLRIGRRRRRRVKQKRETVRVSVDSTRSKNNIRSVSTRRSPTQRVDETSTVAAHFGGSDDAISPANVGNIAATLDAVLGGDPIADGKKVDPANPGAAAPPSEDDLLGDLKDIVSKGLS